MRIFQVSVGKQECQKTTAGQDDYENNYRISSGQAKQFLEPVDYNQAITGYHRVRSDKRFFLEYGDNQAGYERKENNCPKIFYQQFIIFFDEEEDDDWKYEDQKVKSTEMPGR